MKGSRTVNTVFIGIGLLIVISFVATFVAGNHALQTSAQASAHKQVIANFDAVLSSMKDAETGVRGYLLVAHPSYLEPYHTSKSETYRLLQDAENSALNLGSGQQEIDEIHGLIDQVYAEFQGIVDLQSEGQHEAAIDRVRTNRGKQLMDDLRARMATLNTRQSVMSDQATALSIANTYFRTTTFGLMAFLCLAAIMWAGRRLQTEVRRRQLAADEAFRQKEMLEVTLQSIGDGIIVTDEKGVIRFMNPVAVELSGWSNDEARGMPCNDVFRIINEQERKPVVSPVDKVIEQGIIVGLANHTLLIRKDGTEIPIDDSGAPIRDHNGDFFGVVLVFRDFTDRKEYERTLKTARDQAEAANIAKDRFLASLSHELRTPLTPVVAMLSAWQDSPSFPDDKKEDLDLLLRSVNLEARLIDDLLDLTKITQGKLSLNRENVDIHDVIDKTLQLCKSEIHGRHLDVEVKLEAQDHYVYGDHARLQQVVWNILRNAIKFSNSGGTIEVESFNQDGTRLAIRVTDSGIGMDPETLEKMFQPFEQGSNVMTSHGGLGLGMTISHGLVSAHEGAIIPASEGPGKGSSITITLPAMKVLGAERKSGQPKQEMNFTVSPLRILLVEDHPESAIIIGKLLESKGHSVTKADSVAGALEACDAGAFDIILSDVGLPDGTGYEFMEQYRTLYGTKVPSVALTGFGMDEDIAQSHKAGFNEHLTKPVNFQKLDHILAKLTRPN